MNRISNYVSALRWKQMLSLRKAPYHALIQLCGKDGMGKTTIARAYAAEEEGYYFSFRHLESTSALQSFMPGCADWDTFFAKLKRKSNHPTIVFDDVDDRNDKDDFKNALYRHLTERTTVILVLRKEGSGFRYDEAIEVHRMTAYDIRNLFPTLSLQEVLRLLALTDGYPQLVNAYQEELSFAENVQLFFTEGSAFLEYAPIWLRQEFRSPESYNALLYAMATGHNRVSQIASFTGYPKNKCDKYLNALVDANFVTKCTKREASGSLRTYYHPASSYLKLWYRIYMLFSAAGFPNSLKKFGSQYENVYLLDFKTLTRNKTVSDVWI